MVERTSMATVDIVITCYNYGRFLKASVGSALAQRDVDVRVLIVDDASPDGSAAVAARLAEQDRRVRLIALPRNVGMIGAVNLGLREIDGDYFVKLDADDLLTPGSLARSVKLLDRHPEVGFVYGRPRNFTGEFTPRRSFGFPRWKIRRGAEWLALRYRAATNCISQPEAMIRRATLQTVGDYNPKLPHTSDLEMWLRLAAVADVGRINGVDQGCYRIHPDSMQRTVNAGYVTDLLGRRAAFLSVLEADDGRLPAAELEDTVRLGLALQAVDAICRAYDRDCVDRTEEEQLQAFALETYPECVRRPEWAGLQRRRQRGRCNKWAPGSLLAAALRRGRLEMAEYRRLSTGL
jgi:glycosyltransferase involved in cell wall biosynthesis